MSIRRALVAKAVVAASVTGLVVVPVVAVAVEAAAGEVHLEETIVGALLGTLYFSITGVVTMIFQDSDQLRGAVLTSYIVKTSVLLGAAMQLDLQDVDRVTLGVLTAASAISYLVVQTTLIAGRNAKRGSFNTQSGRR